MNHHALSLPTEPTFSSPGHRVTSQQGEARSSVTLDIQVEGSLANGAAVLHDLSTTRASFVARTQVAVPDAMIVLRIPAPQGPIEILARVEWVEPLADARQLVVARFAQIDPDADEALSAMIACLLAVTSKAPGSTAPKRIRLKLSPGPRGGAILNEIARGTLSITLPQPMVHDAWLHIVIPGLSGAEALALGARVVSQRVVWQSGRMAFQVAFAFERMRASDRVTLAALQQIFV